MDYRSYQLQGYARSERRAALREAWLVVACVALLFLLFISGVGAVVRSRLARARRAVNEAACVSQMQGLIAAEVDYRAANAVAAYGTYNQLARQRKLPANLSPTSFTASGNELVTKGYVLTLTIIPASASSPPKFQLRATPLPDSDNVRHFLADQSAVIRFRDGAPAQTEDPPLS